VAARIRRRVDCSPSAGRTKATIESFTSMGPKCHTKPADQPLPGWADTWMREYERGSDMTTFYGTPPDGGPATER